jgi:hypothetical protein
METGWNEAVLKSISDGLELLRARESFTDITICVEGVSYRCHKAVLCLLSPYFNSMFSSNMRESQCEKVSLPFLNCKTFETLLDFFYSGKDVVTAANVEDVLQAASFMQIQCLQDRCVNVLCGTVTAANCIRLWQMAKLHNYYELEEMTWQCVLEEFPTIANNTESFSSLDVDELLSLLKAEDLQSDCESQVCDVALNWLAADIDVQQHLVKVFGSLKLSLTSCDYLLSVKSRFPFIEKHEEANKLLMEACSYHTLPAQTCDKSGDTLVVIGNVDGLNDDTVDVQCFCTSDRRWYKLPPVPYTIGGYAAFCTYRKKKLFVSGGSDEYGFIAKTAMYDGDTNTWTMAGTLNDGRNGHVMVTVGDSLYVLCGNAISIERCNIKDGNYSKIGEMNLNRESIKFVSAAVLGDRIILFGGTDGYTDVTSEVQSFNTVTCTLTVICNMPDTAIFVKSTSIAYDETILTITPRGLILKLIQAHNGTYECTEIGSVQIRRFNLDTDDFCVVAEKDQKMIILGNSSSSMRRFPLEDLMMVRCDTGDVLWTVKMPFTVIDSRLMRLCIRQEHLHNAF